MAFFFFFPGTKWKWDIFTLTSLKHKYLIYFLGPCTTPQFSSVAQSCLTLCEPMDCSTPGFPVHHQFSEFAQTHDHRVSDAIQPSHPLSSPSPSAFSLFQHLFQWVGSLHQVTKVLELQLQHLSFQWIFRTDFIKDGLVWSPCSPRDSQESSPTPQFKSIDSLVLSFLYSLTLTSIMTTGKTIPLTRWTFVVLPQVLFYWINISNCVFQLFPWFKRKILLLVTTWVYLVLFCISKIRIYFHNCSKDVYIPKCYPSLEKHITHKIDRNMKGKCCMIPFLWSI